MRFDVRLLLILTVVTCGTGCGDARDPLLAQAFLRFQYANSCPVNRMNVKHVQVPLADLVVPSQPPAEIAADAERLAVWKQSNDVGLRRYDRLTAVDISGCGGHADYFCWEKHVLHDNYGCIPMDPNRPFSDFSELPLKPSAEPWVRRWLGLPPTPPSPSQATVTQPTGLASFPPEVRAKIAADKAKMDAKEKAIREHMAKVREDVDRAFRDSGVEDLDPKHPLAKHRQHGQNHG